MNKNKEDATRVDITKGPSDAIFSSEFILLEIMTGKRTHTDAMEMTVIFKGQPVDIEVQLDARIEFEGGYVVKGQARLKGGRSSYKPCKGFCKQASDGSYSDGYFYVDL